MVGRPLVKWDVQAEGGAIGRVENVAIRECNGKVEEDLTGDEGEVLTLLKIEVLARA